MANMMYPVRDPLKDLEEFNIRIDIDDEIKANYSKEEIKKMINNTFGVPKFDYDKIIFNGPATIVIWKDGSKTISKCSEDDVFDPEKAVAICFMKRALGDRPAKKILKKEVSKYELSIETISEFGKSFCEGFLSGLMGKTTLIPKIDPKDLHPLKPEQYNLYFDGHTEHVKEINKGRRLSDSESQAAIGEEIYGALKHGEVLAYDNKSDLDSAIEEVKSYMNEEDKK